MIQRIKTWPPLDHETTFPALRKKLAAIPTVRIIEDSFYNHVFKMVMRRIFHLAHGTSAQFHRFPIEFSYRTNSKGYYMFWPDRTPVLVKKVFNRIKKDLTKEQFIVRTFSKPAHDENATYEYIKILGLRK